MGSPAAALDALPSAVAAAGALPELLLADEPDEHAASATIAIPAAADTNAALDFLISDPCLC